LAAVTTVAGREVETGLTDDGETPVITRARKDGRWPFWPALAVLAIGLLITAALTLVSAALNRKNDKQLLGLRTREVGTVLTEVIPSIQTPLASAAALADATGGNVAKFKRFAAPYVGLSAGQPFVSLSLWRVSNPGQGPVAVVGVPPALSASIQLAPAFLARASAKSRLSVTGFLQSPIPRIGYAFAGVAPGPFVAYGESAVPANRYAPVQNNAAFSEIDYAVYLGPSTTRANLLIASVRHLPLMGRTDIVKTPIGDSFFTVAVAARRSLGGSLPQRLPPAIAIIGVLLSAGAALVAARLIDRRRGAERLAARLEEIAEENRRLYAEQRGIAQTLQHALLPETLPQLPGIQTSALYEAGAHGVEIGGDWYDLIALDDRRLLLVVGDVSGRGLRAATTMAALRYAIHAYAAQGDPPAELLSKLSKLVSVKADRQLATVLCALVDVPARTVSVTSAGHLPPLMITGEGGEFVQGEIGLPVGVDRSASYTSTTVSAPPGATLLAYTDGLVERRGESIDAGLERLRSRASTNHVSLDQLLTRILEDLRDDASEDDTAIAGIRWMN
jgi:serine phosphatase RsbU (regulator of sigma subunit)